MNDSSQKYENFTQDHEPQKCFATLETQSVNPNIYQYTQRKLFVCLSEALRSLWVDGN